MNLCWERRFKIKHRLCVALEDKDGMNPALSDRCAECRAAVGSLFRCSWGGPHINLYWITTVQQFNSFSLQP